jgi:hypothetical protein
MTWTIDDILARVEPRIIARGIGYFNEGRVQAIERLGEGEWSASVEGTEIYEVYIHFLPDGVVEHACTCPYDSSPICKHFVAVLYEIEDNLDDLEGEAPIVTRAEGEHRLRRVVESLPKRELVEILLELARDDDQISLDLLARYDPELGSKGEYLRMAREALSWGEDGRGFIGYWGASRAARGLRSVLERGWRHLEEGQAAAALPVAQAVLEITVEAYGHADDSSGQLGECIMEAIDQLATAGPDLEDEDRKELLDYALSKGRAAPFRDWDWGWQLVQIAADLVKTEEERGGLFTTLESMAPGLLEDDASEQDFHSRYNRELAARIMFSLIQRLDGKEPSLEFARDHVQMDFFRRHLIRHHMDRGEFEEVKRLCQEWFEEFARSAPGHRATYLATLLEVAEREGNQTEMRRLTRELFLATAELEYFEYFKQIIPEDDWDAVRHDLIADMNESYRCRSLIPRVYALEEMWDELLAAALNGGKYVIEAHREELEARFPEEICEAYRAIAYAMLERTSDRGTYAAAARYLQRMSDMGFPERAREAIDDLISRYGRRPAMIEELKAVRPTS